jgi:uncharacterized protein YecE (DUF72 family)
MPKLFIGTSGWSYAHWAEGVFYPEGLAQGKWLEYYCRFFNSVELNVSFYRLPSRKVFENWHKRTPKDFYFVAKGSRFITHIKKMKDCQEPLKLFLENLSCLKEKLTAILWQFPPSLKKDLRRLESFLKLLNPVRNTRDLQENKISNGVMRNNTRQTFELRNETWFDKETFDLLKEYNSCLCIADSDQWPCAKEVTADFLYLRFHGRDGLYSGNYSDGKLKEWASFAKRFSAGGGKDKDIFAFFNNDAYGYAVKNALRFKELLTN